MDNSTTEEFDSLKSVDRNTKVVSSPASAKKKPDGESPGSQGCAAKSVIIPIVENYFGSAQKPIIEISELGEGAYSYVFRGKSSHYGNGDGVAIKVMKPSRIQEDNQRLVEMFRRDARTHHDLSWNPFNLLLRRVPLVYESGAIDGIFNMPAAICAEKTVLGYMVVERIKGRDISEKISNPETPLSAIERIAKQLAEALFVVHDSGYVHRDIKPANILECNKRGVMLIDFGLAVKSGEYTTHPAGTPIYIAPEAMIPGILLPSVDIFSFGILLYEAIEKAHPFAESPDRNIGVMQAIRVNQVRKPRNEEALDSGLAQIAVKCLEKDPSRRYRTGFELLNAIDRL